MNRIEKRKKFIIINMGIILLASILAYPLFATESTTGETNNPAVASVETKATVGTQFTDYIFNNDKQTLSCKFSVLTEASNGNPGTVVVVGSIDKNTQGTIAFPDTVSDGNDRYVITEIGFYAFQLCTGLTNTGLDNNSTIKTIWDGAFSHCTGLTSTGLANNTTVTSIGGSAFQKCTSLTSTGLEDNASVTSLGDYVFIECTGLKSTGLESNTTLKKISNHAFRECTGLKSTGLESNSTVTTMGYSVFYECTGLTSTGLEKNKTITSLSAGVIFLGCTGLKSTGLENNTTITTIGSSTFERCTGLTSTGLERNTTVKSLGKNVFSYCTNLGDIAFEITTLPTMKSDVFINTNANVYYLPETTNPAVLENCGASVYKMIVDEIAIHTPPKKTEYIEEQSFDATGLVLNVTYSTLGTVQRSYDDIAFQNLFTVPSKVSLGDTSVTIGYGDSTTPELIKTTTQNIKVNEKSITGIIVKNPPTKVEYIEGEDFNATGLVLTVSYDIGTSEDIMYNDSTKDMFSFNKTEVSLKDTNITITYGNNSTTQAITVKEKEVTEITVVNKPTKLEYQEGENFNPEGLKLEVSYNNGSKEEVEYNEETKDMFTYNENKLTVKDTKVVIEYGGKEVEIDIKVKGLESQETVDTSDTTMIVGFMLLLGVSITGILKYRVKQS